MPTSTRQVSCEFIRADVGIRPYDADFNTAVNYNLYVANLAILLSSWSVSEGSQNGNT